MYNEIIDKLKDKNICILGFGREGVSTYNFIRRHLKDKFITIIDKNDISSKIENDNNVNIIYGESYLDNLDVYDLIIKTPGISFKDIDTTKIKDKITSQFELILEVFSQNIIAITGTKGKSTTSTLIYNIIKNNNIDTYLLGNIGNPMLDDVEKFNSNTKLVIESSALQLEFIKVSPHIGIVLNLFEDHLDHAGTVYHYHEEKMNMFKYQNNNDYGIYFKDNSNIINWINNNNYISNLISVSLTEKSDIYLDNDNVIYKGNVIYNKNNERKLLGEHNLSNIMFALVVSDLLNLDINKTLDTIKNFNPLEHRLELVGIVDGVTYYNDSISTIPQATINALKSLKDVDTLIFGGMDRGIDYTELVNYLSICTVRNLICMPSTGYKIGKELENTDKNIYFIEQLKDAVKLAKEITSKGKICLMSPAASSYEYFKNFEDKGTQYKNFVLNKKDI